MKEIEPGTTYNRLSFIALTDRYVTYGKMFQKRYRLAAWQCKCGNVTLDVPAHVRSGAVKSCGCAAFERHVKVRSKYAGSSKVKNHTGMRAGRLTCTGLADSFMHSLGGKKVLWNFKCDCGREINTTIYDVKINKVRECAVCANLTAKRKRERAPLRMQRDFQRAMAKYSPLVGEKRHRLTLVEYSHIDSRRGYMWTFKCDCGQECKASAAEWLRGNAKSCGCLRAEVSKRLAEEKRGKPAKNRKDNKPAWGIEGVRNVGLASLFAPAPVIRTTKATYTHKSD